MINATGLGTDVDKADDPLFQRLRHTRMLSGNPFGGTNAGFATDEVLAEDDTTISGLFALAVSLTIGIQGFVNSLLKVSKCVIRTGETIFDRMAVTMNERSQDVKHR